MQEDYQSKGVGLNNNYIFNDKLNLNYAVSFNDNRYHSKSSPVDPQGNQTFVDAGQLNNSEIYSASIRLNYNLSNKTQISSKLIFSDVQHSKSYDSHESSGLNLSISKIFNIGTFTASATHLTNSYDSRKITVSSLKDREDNSLVTFLNFRGDINQILPFLRKINKDSNIYYSLSFKESDVISTISSYQIKRSFKTIEFSKRINLND